MSRKLIILYPRLLPSCYKNIIQWSLHNSNLRGELKFVRAMKNSSYSDLFIRVCYLKGPGTLFKVRIHSSCSGSSYGDSAVSAIDNFSSIVWNFQIYIFASIFVCRWWICQVSRGFADQLVSKGFSSGFCQETQDLVFRLYFENFLQKKSKTYVMLQLTLNLRTVYKADSLKIAENFIPI